MSNSKIDTKSKSKSTFRNGSDTSGINLADAHIFLETLCSQEGQVVTFQTYDDQKRGRVKAQHCSGTLTYCQKRLEAENRKGAGIFVMVNEGDLKGRSEKNVTGVRAVFLDLDGSPLEAVLAWDLKSHLITQTSPGPDGRPRYQCFWLVKDFPWTNDQAANKALFSAVQRAICDKFSGDKSITQDMNRVMRIPGFYHQKREPFLCELVEAKSHPPYSAQEILAALGVDITRKKDVPQIEVKQTVEGPVPEGDRNNFLTSQAGKLRNIGLDYDELLPALAAINTRRCTSPLGERELETIVRSICKYPPGKIHTSPDKKLLPVGISFAELLEKELPPPRWIIQDLLPEGLAILAGAPKTRKSWLAQNLALFVATGTEALGHYPCKTGAVLHLALEDNPRRFQDRLKLMCNGTAPPKNALFFNTWPKLDEGGVDLIQKSVMDNPDIRLVIVDTLAVVKPSHGKESNSYGSDYGDLSGLQQLAGRHEVAIVVIHHTRKADAKDVMDEISGTRGLSGCADSLFVMKAEHREKLDATLHFTGRDLEAGSIALEFDKDRGLWLYVGNAADVKLSQGRREIWDVLGKAGKPLTIIAIHGATGGNYETVKKTVYRMAKKGELLKTDGLFTLPLENQVFGRPLTCDQSLDSGEHHGQA